MKRRVRFRLNHEPVDLNVDPERLLLWVLRSDLELTGTKCGCELGVCSACTVLVDRKAVLACQMTVEEIEGKDVVTIEGLARNGELHPVQKAFVEHAAFHHLCYVVCLYPCEGPFRLYLAPFLEAFSLTLICHL